ncbi:MAG: L-aspartate oxidase [Dermatophilaceae bacterium]
MTVDLGTLAGRPVIVGAGLAGLVTALELAPTPCVLVTGGALGVDCASDWAQGGLAAAVGPDDSIAAHVADSLAAGAGLCDAEVTRSIVDAGPSVVDFLRELGARFDTSRHGTLDLGLEGAHSRRRIVHAAGDGSGHEITRAAVEAVRSAGHVTVLEHTLARRILTRDGVTGIVLLTTEGAHTLRTGYVVLATGGAGALFTHTTNPSGSWGSGLALGLRAGAAVRDLEMVQFHPTALDVSLDPMPLVSEAVRGEGAHLVDDRGERVLADDLAPRDVVSRAVWARLDAGRRVFLDTPSAFGDSFARHFPTITAKCAAVGLDPAVDPLPVRPAAHYHMGGLLTDARGRTTVHGLWAVGEVASTGLHGANRLASNSLLEAVAVGREVARDVRALAPTTPALALVGSRQPHSGGAFGEPLPVWPGRPTQQDRLTLERRCGVLRDEARLDEAIDLLRPGAQARDARLVALLVAWSAYGRTESRGGHHRTDHPRCGAGGHTVFTLDEALAAIDDRHSRMRSA